MQADGNDLIAMRAVLDEAITRARAGGGGTVIEAVTYRLSDHTTADDARRYREDDEVKAAWAREPMKRLRAYLTSVGAWSDTQETAWKADCEPRVDAEINAYLETKPQALESMFDYLYGDMPSDVREQREQILRGERGGH